MRQNCSKRILSRIKYSRLQTSVYEVHFLVRCRLGSCSQVELLSAKRDCEVSAKRDRTAIGSREVSQSHCVHGFYGAQPKVQSHMRPVSRQLWALLSVTTPDQKTKRTTLRKSRCVALASLSDIVENLKELCHEISSKLGNYKMPVKLREM